MRSSYINQIETYQEYRFKINPMIKLKNLKKNKNPNIKEGWRKKTKNSIFVSLIVNLVSYTYLDYVFC